MMRKIFKNPAFEQKFRQDGYLTVPLLSKDDIQQCYDIYKKVVGEEFNQVFYTSHWNRDATYRRRIHDALNPLLSQRFNALFHRYKSPYSYFLVKHPHEEGEVAMHQDWTLIDEKKFVGVTAWCPLIDVEFHNGAFHVIKGSHRFLNNIRGDGFPFTYGEIKYEMEDYLEEVAVKAGTAVFFDHRLVHASPPNLSHQVRIAVGNVLIPHEAQFVHYRYNPQRSPSQLEYYTYNDEFLLEYAFGDSPEKLNFQKLVPKDNRTINLETFDRLYRTYNKQMPSQPQPYRQRFGGVKT